MAMFELSFGFRQPYQTLGANWKEKKVDVLDWNLIISVDSNMCMAAQDHKIELVKQLETVLQGKIKPSMNLGFEIEPGLNIMQ